MYTHISYVVANSPSRLLSKRVCGNVYGICKYNSSRFWDETSNMAKFTKLMETSFNDSNNMKYAYP